MRFSVTRWPAVVMRPASSWPDVSVAAVRVSDTVSTAMLSGTNRCSVFSTFAKGVSGEAVNLHISAQAAL